MTVGARLRVFREGLPLSLRAAARQLHVAHPALKDWESDEQTPAPPYREAIEVWTEGTIKASEWPLSGREHVIVENAGLVKAAVAAVPRDRKSGPIVDEADTLADLPHDESSKPTGTGR